MELEVLERGDRLEKHEKDGQWTSVTYCEVVYINLSDREILLDVFGSIHIYSEAEFKQLGLKKK